MDAFDKHNEQSKLCIDSIKINESLSCDKKEKASLDNIIKKCGDLGRFQLIHYFFLNLIPMGCAVAGFYYVFAAAEPNHRCRLPENILPDDTQYNPINETYQKLIQEYIPKMKDGKTWEKCVRYSHPYDNKTLINCPDGWVYDRSVFGYTFTEEANFVCNNGTKRSWLATLMQCGGFALLIIGSFADRYGRRKVTAFVTIFLLCVCLLTQILIQWVEMSIKAKFILLLINQFASGLTSSTFSLVFILMLELTSSSHPIFAGNAALASFAFGETILTLFAYLTRDWKVLKWTNTAFIALILPYLYFMPESPRYLYSKQDYTRLEAFLRKMAKVNRRSEDDWYPLYQNFIQNQPTALVNEAQPAFLEKLRQIFTHRLTVLKLLITALLGFTTLMVYIKISYGLAVMNISPYIGILIGAVVEAFGYMAGSIFISSRLGRKGSFICMLTLTIICVVLIPILIEHSTITTFIIAQFGKFTISGAIAVSWIYVPELFPTAIRGGSNGFFMAFSRLGAIVAPIINTSVSSQYLPYTFYASAGLAVIVVFLSLALPETKNKSMDDVQDYATNQTDA